MPERLDRIHFDVGGRQVEMPWSVGQELKTRALKSPSTQSIAAKMDAVGGSRPVDVLETGEMLALIELLEHWTRNADDTLPESVGELRGAVRDAVHNRRRGSSRPGRVHVDVAGEIVEINLHERDVLLEELAFIEGTKTIRERFEAVGASRAVELDAEQRARLLTALEWGEDRLQPEGLTRLHAALSAADPGP
jgi:hypothetical protein